MELTDELFKELVTICCKGNTFCSKRESVKYFIQEKWIEEEVIQYSNVHPFINILTVLGYKTLFKDKLRLATVLLDINEILEATLVVWTLSKEELPKFLVNDSGMIRNAAQARLEALGR